MPSISTHIYVGKNILKNNKQLNKNYFLSGYIFPDIYYFFKKENNVSDYWHETDDLNNIGIDFGYKVIKFSKNNKELSFSLGFLSHFLVDKKVHAYLRKNYLLNNYKHQVIENFLGVEDRVSFPFLRYPKNLLEKSFTENKNYRKQININFFRKVLFFLKINIVDILVYQKYKKKKNNFLINFLLLNIVYNDILKKDREKIIQPSLFIKKKYLKEVNKIILKSEKDIKKLITKYQT